MAERGLNAEGPAAARPAWVPGLGLALACAAWVLIYSRLRGLASWFTFGLAGLGPSSRFAGAVDFFAFEGPKVLMLMLAVVFGVGVLRSFVTPGRARAMLAGRREALGNVLAALLGIATPFCSCSAVPLFIGFVTSGVPLGVTLTFLVASPMVNEVALVLLFALFGWKVAALYVGTGLAVAMLAGWFIGRLGLEDWVEPWVYQLRAAPGGEIEARGLAERLKAGGVAVRDIVGKVWPWVLAGIAVGAFIHGYVPADFMASFMGRSAWWAVPVSVLMGVPMYSNAAGIIPIVQALMEKGAALGTVLAFMMSVIGLSAPEAIILRKVLKPRLIALFFGTVAAGILVVGYLFNAVF